MQRLGCRQPAATNTGYQFFQFRRHANGVGAGARRRGRHRQSVLMRRALLRTVRPSTAPRLARGWRAASHDTRRGRVTAISCDHGGGGAAGLERRCGAGAGHHCSSLARSMRRRPRLGRAQTPGVTLTNSVKRGPRIMQAATVRSSTAAERHGWNVLRRVVVQAASGGALAWHATLTFLRHGIEPPTAAASVPSDDQFSTQRHGDILRRASDAAPAVWFRRTATWITRLGATTNGGGFGWFSLMAAAITRCWAG